MSTELFMDNSRVYAAKREEDPSKNIHFQNPDQLLPISDEEISPEKVFLLSKFYIDIKFIYPLSYPSPATLYIWHFPPSILLSFSFFLFQFLSSFHPPFKLIHFVLKD